MSTLAIHQLSKKFAETEVLKQISLTVESGEFMTLLGPSGCGKTTLLRIIAGLETPDSGSISIDHTAIVDVADNINQQPQLRQLGYVFQDYGLWPHMTVWENLAFPLQMLGQSKSQIKNRTNEVLETVRLTEHAHKKPEKLSGGQQQRVSIARALAAKPRVILFDEPLSNLDANLREEVGHEIRTLTQSLGLTCINVTHDRREAQLLSDRIALVLDGKIHQLGVPETLFKSPKDEWAARFMDAGNILQRPELMPGLESIQSPVCIPRSAITIAENGDCEASVTEARFISDRYEVTLSTDSETLKCYTTASVPIGASVRFQINRESVTAFSDIV